MYRSAYMQRYAQDKRRFSSLLDSAAEASSTALQAIRREANSIASTYDDPCFQQGLRTLDHLAQNAPALTLDDVADALEARCVYEERENGKLLALCYVAGLHVGVEGPSGTGKSHLVNTFLDCLEDEVYTCSLSSSTAAYYDETITSADILYFSELQKAGRDKTLLEMIKDLSEGKESVRRVTANKKTQRLLIPAGKQLIYTLADENTYDLDHELSRRFVRLRTNTSAHAVRKRKEAILLGKETRPLEIGYTLNNLKHTARPVKEAYPQLVLNLLPDTNKTISAMQQYCALIKAHAQFLGRDVTEPQDHAAIYTLFGARFEEQLSQLEGEEVKLNQEVLDEFL